jgi:diguanylate cyclase (GGDEF)-like protein
MEIRETKPRGAAAGVRKAEARAVAAVDAAAPAEASASAAEIVSLSGIPEPELTPRVTQAILALMGEVQQLRRQLDDAKSRISYLERLADEDALMPIANRRAFVRELSRAMAFAQRYGTPSSVVYFDLNGLKRINDEHGHAAGDAALQHVARILVDSVRNTDVVGRLGGDEFGVLLMQSDEETARKKAESLAAAIVLRPLLWQAGEIALSAAFGVHAITPEENAAEAIDAADRAMYQNKRAGQQTVAS